MKAGRVTSVEVAVPARVSRFTLSHIFGKL